MITGLHEPEKNQPVKVSDEKDDHNEESRTEDFRNEAFDEFDKNIGDTGNKEKTDDENEASGNNDKEK